MDIKLKWSKLSDTKYDIYRCSYPGEDYELLDTIEPSGDDVEEYTYERLLKVNNLQGFGTNHIVTLKWNEVLGGSPYTYKIVPYDSSSTPQPLFSPSKDNAWMSDTLPSGSLWLNSTGSSWDTHSYHGLYSLKVEATNGYVYPHFDLASFPITDKYITIWTYIDSKNVPDSLMITLYDGSWAHRVYWGSDLFPYGIEGTPSMYYMGSIPTPDCWTPLIIDKDLVKAEDVSGMGFGVYKLGTPENPQTGIAYFDSVYSSNERIYAAEQQYIPVDNVLVYRKGPDETKFNFIGQTRGNQFIDEEAYDVFGYNASSYRPNYSLVPDAESVTIRWSVPTEFGTQYTYRTEVRDKSGDVYDYSEIVASVTTQHGRIKIKGGTSNDYENLPLLAEIDNGNEFIHSGLVSETTYYYRLEAYNDKEDLLSIVDTRVTTRAGSRLDFFILDKSSLA